jgi:hypothetical protein
MIIHTLGTGREINVLLTNVAELSTFRTLIPTGHEFSKLFMKSEG